MNLPNGYLLQQGKYKLTQVVGQGGFGITYKGVWFTEVKGALGTIHTEVPVCIKEFFFKDYCDRDPETQAVSVHSETGKQLFGKFREKLIKEAKILSDVHHPYIVNVLEVFEENNTAYIVMEYIAGQSLKYKLEKEGVLPEKLVLKYVRQVGEALQFVHEKQIVHLDIKPSNILLDTHDDARLIDFGVSKRYDMEQQETSTTMLTLSKGFASVEQYDDEGTQSFSPCPDIYSLGATMYNLLTGKIPTESILRVTRPLVPPRELNPAISEKTEAAILRAMELAPEKRFQTVAEMMSALDLPEIVPPEENLPAPTPPETPQTAVEGDEETVVKHDEEETIVSTPPTMPAKEEPTNVSPTEQKPRGKRWMVAAAVALAAIAGIWGIATNGEKPEEQTPIAQTETPEPTLPEPETEQPEAEATPTPQQEEPKREPAVAEPQKVAEPQQQTPTKPETRPEETEKPQPTPQPAEEPTEETDAETANAADIDRRYNDLLASGRGRMKAEDYAGAKADFTAARNLKLTEEVVRLMIDCDAKAEEQRTEARIAQYEEKMAFGDYRIVRKKSNGRYGAIDENGYEKIPCRYLSVGIAEGGRAFERTDNLFDIYNTKGELITEGATYY